MPPFSILVSEFFLNFNRSKIRCNDRHPRKCVNKISLCSVKKEKLLEYDVRSMSSFLLAEEINF
jgi:hypothetical protein